MKEDYLKIVLWNGSWPRWRLAMEAASELMGVGHAFEAGVKTAIQEDHKPNEAALKQSQSLSSIIMLSMGNGEESVHASIARDAFYKGRNGILAVSQLIKHFELTNVGGKTDELSAEFHSASLEVEQDPDTLYYKLVELQRQLKNLGETVPELEVTRRLVSELEKEYPMEIALYRNSRNIGQDMSLEKFRLMIQHAYKMKCKEKSIGAALKCAYCYRKGHKETECRNKPPSLNKGKPRCTNCSKIGHSQEDCWHKNHSYQKKNYRVPNKNETMRREPRCYQCNEYGHIQRNCPQKNNVQTAMQAIATNQANEPNQATLVDSGCTIHLVNDTRLLDPGTSRAFSGNLTMADGRQLHIRAVGKRSMIVGEHLIQLQKVHYADGLHQNLFSVKAAAKEGATTIFDKHQAIIKKDTTRIKLVNRQEAWYLPTNEVSGIVMPASASWRTWHERLGHPGQRKLDLLEAQEAIKIIDRNEATKECVPCSLSKPRRAVTNKIATPSGNAVVQVDVMAWSTRGWKGEKYAAIFSHRESKLDVAYLYHEKHEAIKALEHYLTNIKPRLVNPIDTIQTDAGSELTSKAWEETCAKGEVMSRRCPVDYQALNGQTERSQGVIASMMRAMLRARQVPERFWPLALNTAVYLKNRMPHDAINGEIPIYKAFGHKKMKELKSLKVFGCRAFVTIPKSLRKGKGGDVRWRGIMVGYSPKSPEYLIYDPTSQKIRNAYSVVFHEDICGFPNKRVNIYDDKDENVIDNYQPETVKSLSHDVFNTKQEILTDMMTPDRDTSVGIYDCPSSEIPERENEKDILREESNEDKKELPREETYPVYPDQLGTLLSLSKNSSQMDEIGYCMISGGEISLSKILNGEEKEKWLEAIRKEMHGLERNSVLGNEPCPEGVRPLGTRYVLTNKKNPDGTTRYKARLVVKGYRQIFGVDYHESFSSVVKFDIFRAILAVATIKGWTITTLDFEQAYLNAKLNEDLWVELPNKEIKKLRRALYGLKQAGNKWQETYTKHILRRDPWKQSKYDECVFFANDPKEKHIAILWIYVDDSGFTGDWIDETQKAKRHLLEAFSGRDIGIPNTYVGMELTYRENGMLVHQKSYAEGIVKEHLGNAAREANTPLQKGADLSPRNTKTEEPLDVENYPYRRALGQILYLANMTRPDLSNAVRELGRVGGDPAFRHWRSLQHVMRYISATKEHGLLFEKQQDEIIDLIGYSDADFAGDTTSRKSCTGYVIKLGTATIDWVSRTQRTVSTSTTEAEWTALHEGTRHGEFVKGFLNEINFRQSKVRWWCDNEAAVTAATTPGHCGRTRHLDVKLKKTREMVTKGLIEVHYIPTTKQEADGLTKRLEATAHKRFRNYLMSK